MHAKRTRSVCYCLDDKHPTNRFKNFAGFCPKRESGFSLIEILIVMVLVAVAAAGVTIAINPQGSVAKQLNKQGDTLFQQMQFAQDEAVFNRNGVGLLIEVDPDTEQLKTEYQWLAHDGENWKKRGEPLTTGKLASGMAWQVEVEQVSLEQSLDDLLEQEEEQQLKPSIVFYPDGEITAFVLELTPDQDALANSLDGVNDRYKIAVNNRGALVRYLVGEVEQE